MRTYLTLLLLFISSVFALQDYCKSGYKLNIADKEFELDLSKLNSEFSINQSTKTSPYETIVKTTLNICDPLQVPDDKSKDFCDKGTYICRDIIYTKDDKELLVEIQPIAGDYEKRKLEPELKPTDTNGDATKSGFKYSLTLKGGYYVDQSKSAVITLECDESKKREDKPDAPIVTGYTSGVLLLEWKTVFACAYKPGDKKPDNGNDNNNDNPPADNGSQSSGVWTFFKVVFILAGVYFVAGAAYNYKVYNARGLDLIPHRDFWLDLPYHVRNLFAQVVDMIMSRRRGSGGYVAV